MVRIQVVSEEFETKVRFFSDPIMLDNGIANTYYEIIKPELDTYKAFNPACRVFVLFSNIEVENG